VRGFARSLAGLCLAAFPLSACGGKNGTGFIQIKTVPVATVSQPPLYLDSDKLEPLKKGEAVVTRRVGVTKLQAEGAGGQLAVLCEIHVRKNRITTVTISIAEKPPRCQCRNNPDAASRIPRTCLG